MYTVRFDNNSVVKSINEFYLKFIVPKLIEAIALISAGALILLFTLNYKTETITLWFLLAAIVLIPSCLGFISTKKVKLRIIAASGGSAKVSFHGDLLKIESDSGNAEAKSSIFTELRSTKSFYFLMVENSIYMTFPKGIADSELEQWYKNRPNQSPKGTS